MTARDALQRDLARAITERELQGHVAAAAKTFGWHYFHSWTSMHSPRGFPDCFLVRRDRAIAAELKRQAVKDEAVPAAQLDWLEALGRVPGIETYIWRPSDWLDGTIEAALR